MDNYNDRREQRRAERKERWEEWRKKWEERREYSMANQSRHGHIWTGLFILLVGVAALLKASITSLPDWLFSWPMFLIALGVFSGFKHGFRGSAWAIMMLIGGFFLCAEIVPDLNIRRYIWPLALIMIGVFLILRPRRRHNWQWPDDQKKKQTDSSGGIAAETAVAEECYNSQKEYQEDFVDSTSIFGGAKKIIISKNFKGGDLVNIFGGTELDLSRADFNGTAVIELTTVFGGTKLILPSNWTVKSEAVTIFGGLEDKRNMQTLTDNPEKLLLLRGTIIFGGIEIKSF
jgi:predicted membrane protein